MPSRNQLAGVAIAGWGLVGILIVVFLSLNLGESHFGRSEANEHPCNAIDRSDESRDCREYEDLLAQRRMARASEDLLDLTNEQVQQTRVVVIWSVIGALATIIAALATAYAAWAAKLAARAAEKTLDDIERPWIFRDVISVQWRGQVGQTTNDWWVSIKWKNVGRAPALLERLEFKFEDIDALGPVPDYSDAQSLPVIDAMPVEGVDFDTQRVGLASPQTKNGKPVEYVFFGRLFYREMSGKKHISGFALTLGPHFPVAMSYPKDTYNYYT